LLLVPRNSVRERLRERPKRHAELTQCFRRRDFTYNTLEGVVCAALIDAPEALSDPTFPRELSDAVVAMLNSLPQDEVAAE
jgi:hypothetical protein